MDLHNPHTCTTCSVAFKDGALQREHYKTDWHRYNLKRKVAEMPPVTLEAFEEKMSKHQEKMKVCDTAYSLLAIVGKSESLLFKALSGEMDEPSGYCVCCRKSFNNQKAYDNHLNSKKHKQTASKFEAKDNKMEIANNRLNRKPSESTTDVVEEDSEGEVEEVDSDEWDDEEVEGGEAVPNTDCIFCSHHSRYKQLYTVLQFHGLLCYFLQRRREEHCPFD
jgi:pre-60S factor REI1